MSAVVGPRTVIHLVRHGEVHNPDRVLYGRLPGYSLSERGREQARATAVHLAAAGPVAVLVSSPLERTVETAAAVADATGAAAGTDARLIEAANVFEGRPLNARAGLVRPGSLRYLRNPWRPSWGEPYTEIAARVLDLVDEVRRGSPGQAVVLVSHQSPIWVTRRVLEGRPAAHDPRRRVCALASVTTLTFDGEDLAGIGYVEPAEQL